MKAGFMNYLMKSKKESKWKRINRLVVREGIF